ncbi:hypothetical protein BLA29_011754 [Euroglyphus maynei]|uniref:Uncharacterized protein n=1 Tax=Euroglyphus maynei TaxID=6958 RepID=A0A1Y3B9T4_EURMA|nr:hypothetical protein BLA29_011754 [Euroglyphus maynei]
MRMVNCIMMELKQCEQPLTASMHHPTIVPNVHDPRAYNNYRFSSISFDSGRGSETTFTNKVF